MMHIKTCTLLTALFLLSYGEKGEGFIPADTIFSNRAGISDTSDLRSISERLRQTGLIRAEFIQNKPSPSNNKRLKSTGEFLFSRDKGIIWHIMNPFDMIILITDQGSVWECRDTGACKRVSAGMGRQFETMASLLSGDLSGFREEFTLFFHMHNNGNWGLGLEPDRRIIARYLNRIIIRGDKMGRVTRFTLETEERQKTEIVFRNHSTDPVTEYEQHLFKTAE